MASNLFFRRSIAALQIALLSLTSAPALALLFQAGTASAQSIAFDNRPRPGSPITGWCGNFSSSEPYSEGPGKGAWITKAGLIHSRSEVGVAEVNGKMYVLGGYADGNVAQPLNEEYDPATDLWFERAPLLKGGNHIAAVGLAGKLYAIGGFNEQNADAFADVSVYDPATDKWSAPGFIEANTASVGPQAGGEQSFVVVVLTTTNSAQALTQPNFAPGGEAGATAGYSSGSVQSSAAPVAKDAKFYSDRNGFFGGAAMKFGGISPDDNANTLYYGKSVTMADVLFNHEVTRTPAGDQLTQAIHDHSKEAKAGSN